MAGESVYIGQLFKAMTDKLTSMITKLDSQITALGAINSSVAQGVNTLNVKVGSGKTVVLNAAEISKTGTVEQVAVSFKSFCAGYFTLDAQTKINGTGNGRFSWRKNGGSWNVTTVTATSYTPVSAVIPIAVGDLIEIGLYGTLAGTITYMAANATVKYSLLDIVNEGAFAIV